MCPTYLLFPLEDLEGDDEEQIIREQCPAKSLNSVPPSYIYT